VRHRRGTIAALATAAALALAALGAGSASAAEVPFNSTLDHGLVKLGLITEPMLDETTGPVTLSGTMDDTTGDFTIPVDGITLPQTSFIYAFPGIGDVPVVLTYNPNGPITGNFDAATGALEADLSTETQLNAFGTVVECHFNPIDLHFSTSASKPFPAQPFTEGIDGPGSIAADWTVLPEATYDPNSQFSAQFCPILAGLGAPGGVWLSNGIEQPPLPAKLDPAKVDPATKKVKYRGSATFTVSSKNSGGSDAQNAEVCAAVPKQLTVVGDECHALGTLAPDAAVSEQFTIKAKRGAGGKTLDVKFTVQASGIAKKNVTAKMTVKKKRHRHRHR
jgi:uncharacterized repeat protein (TIGR01451 family)